MTTIVHPSSDPISSAGIHRLAALEASDAVGTQASDHGFALVVDAYRGSGGLARGDDLARTLEEHGSGDLMSLARMIADGQLFGFHWHGEFWVPMFQIDTDDLTVKPGVQAVLGELIPAFDGWAIALWFVHPNSWLQGQRPLDVLASHLPAVLEAARGDHFVASG